MKRLFFVLTIVALFSLSCGGSDNGNKSGSDAAVTNADGTYVKTLTYYGFIQKVWDFENNPNEFVFKGERPCVIDFYATWCGPCKMVAPIIEKLAEEYNGKIDFYKVDCDQEMDLSMALQVRNIPTVFFLSSNVQPSKTVGAKDEAFYRSQIKALLGE